MGLRRNLGILRRRTWTIIAFGIVVGALVGAMVGGYSAVRSSTYSANARVMLRLDDPAQLLNPLAPPATATNAARDVMAQLDIVTSAEVAKRAVARVPGATVAGLRDAVSVRRVGADALIEITGTSASRIRAARRVGCRPHPIVRRVHRASTCHAPSRDHPPSHPATAGP